MAPIIYGEKYTTAISSVLPIAHHFCWPYSLCKLACIELKWLLYWLYQDSRRGDTDLLLPDISQYKCSYSTKLATEGNVEEGDDGPRGSEVEGSELLDSKLHGSGDLGQVVETALVYDDDETLQVLL